jgi:hypothetical protein
MFEILVLFIFMKKENGKKQGSSEGAVSQKKITVHNRHYTENYIDLSRVGRIPVPTDDEIQKLREILRDKNKENLPYRGRR